MCFSRSRIFFFNGGCVTPWCAASTVLLFRGIFYLLVGIFTMSMSYNNELNRLCIFRLVFLRLRRRVLSTHVIIIVLTLPIRFTVFSFALHSAIKSSNTAASYLVLDTMNIYSMAIEARQGRNVRIVLR